jgi:hypothetical protein
MLTIQPNARTIPAVRAEIAQSSEASSVIARRHGVSAETVHKRTPVRSCRHRSLTSTRCTKLVVPLSHS